MKRPGRRSVRSNSRKPTRKLVKARGVMADVFGSIPGGKPYEPEQRDLPLRNEELPF